MVVVQKWTTIFYLVHKYLMIKKFEEYISEGFWKDGIKRAKDNAAREEDALGHHQFTDGNGKFHKHGIKIEGDDIEDDIAKVIVELYNRNPDLDRVIDLNFLDMSEVDSVYRLFGRILMRLNALLNSDLSYRDILKLKLDTSGWDLRNCLSFNNFVDGWMTDCGIDGWKIDPDAKIRYKDFLNSYYTNHLPKWFKLDVAEWAESTAVKGEIDVEFEVDKERTKKEGKECYLVTFNGDVKFHGNIPDEITIKEIKNGRYDLSIDVRHMTSLKGLPEKINFNNNNKNSLCVFIIDPCIIEDDEIVIPEGVTRLNMGGCSDISHLSKFSKKINCDLMFSKKEQLFYFDEVGGDVFPKNKRLLILKSLVSCPKTVGGNFDASKQAFVDLTGSPEYVGGSFSCSSNLDLKSLKGCPKYVGQSFDICNTGIEHIDEFPEYVGGSIYASGLKYLENFVGLPDEVNGDLTIVACEVKSLDGLPTKIKGTLFIKNLEVNGNPVTIKDIKKLYPSITRFYINDETINEGFWKDGIKRAKDNKERLEDIRTNINKLGTVDINVDVLFADDDLMIDGEYKFDYETFEREYPHIYSKGWRLPTEYEMSKWFNKVPHQFNTSKYECIGYTEDKSHFIIKSHKTKECLSFPLTERTGIYKNIVPGAESYWLLPNLNTNEQGIMEIRPGDKYDPFRFYVIDYGKHPNSRVRLVRDKSIKEGFWKSSINRSKSGEKRLEDITPFERYLKDIEWVDMGYSCLFAKYDFPLDYKISDENLWSIEDLTNLNLPEGIGVMGANEVKFLTKNAGIELIHDDTVDYRNQYESVKLSANGNEIFFHIHPWNTPYGKCSYVLPHIVKSTPNELNVQNMTVYSKEPHLSIAPNLLIRTDGSDDVRYKKKMFTIKLIKKK